MIDARTKEILGKVGGVIAFAIFAAIVLRLSVSTGLWFWIPLIVLVGLPIMFMKTDYLQLKYAVMFWIFLAVILLPPAFSPGIHNAITSGWAYVDHIVGEKLRVPDNGRITVTTDTQCDIYGTQISKEYSEKAWQINESNLSVVEKAKLTAEARLKADKDLQDINTALCGSRTPRFDGNIPQVIPAAYYPPTTSGSSNASTFRVTVNSRTPWTNTDIDVTGKTVSIRRVSGCWNNVNDKYDQCGEGLGPYPGTIIQSAPIGALIAKTGNGYHSVGQSGSIYNSRGNLLLGMNEVPGKHGDNHGELVVEITVQ